MTGCVPDSLKAFFSENPRIAIAFSGGTDSSYLVYAAKECGADFTAYSVETSFRSPVERGNADAVASALGIPVTVIQADPLSVPEIMENPPDRCYLCKKTVFNHIRERSMKDGYTCIADASNASDDPSQRPGMRALEEMGVLSPLRSAGLTKSDIRRLSKEAGLPTWNVPSDSCLATRIRTGRRITEDDLCRISRTESGLRDAGLSGIRVRVVSDDESVLEVPDSQMSVLKGNYEKVSRIMDASFASFTISERIAPPED